MKHHNRNNTALYALILMLCAGGVRGETNVSRNTSEVFNFTVTNGSVLLPTASQITKAMTTHREAEPNCYVCGASQSLFGQATYAKFIDGYERPLLKDKKIRANDWMKMHGLYIEVKNLPVHHKKSQKPFPELADDKGNLITFCWSCHFWLGHLKGHYQDHEVNLIFIADGIKAFVASNSVSFNSLEE